jgi:hypothetical protein
MTRLVLPALQLRDVRVRLLAWSYEDAATGADDGGRGSKPTSRIPGRNLELWSAGSYAELERATDALRAHDQGWARMFWRLYTQRDWLAAPVGPELRWVTERMPRDVFVPQDISEVAGYPTGVAKMFTRRRAKAA